MEITELNLIGDFEAGIKCLQNPTLLSKISLIDKVPRLYSFWTFGALILAVFATFSSVFKRIKLFLYVIRDRLYSSYKKSCPEGNFDQDDFDFDFDFSDDGGGDDDTPSSVAESDEEEEEEEFDWDENRDNDVFRVWGNEGGNGSFGLRRRNGFSWSDFSAGKSVVQLWDSFGLGLDFEDDEFDSGNEIAIWDFNRDVKLSSGRRCEVAPAPENVVLTAEMNGSNGGVGFGTYDSRVDGNSPEVYATWLPRRRNV